MTIGYTVLEDIARGGFGRVQKVRLEDGSIAALKVFDPSAAVLAESDRDKLLARFRREVNVHANLPSAVVLPVLDQDLSDDPPWFLLPFSETNYAEKIRMDRAAGKVDPKPLADILAGLEEIHRLGFVHRDIKPSNILLHEGQWKLSDFGLVTPAIGEFTGITATGSSWGTAIYKAPEQHQNFHGVSHHADMYSFGCLLHDFYGTPRVPFERLTVPGPLGPIIEKCTERDPRRRFRDIAALRDAILGIIARQELSAATTDAESWMGRLKPEGIALFSSHDLEELVRFLRTASSTDRSNILTMLDNPIIEALREVDEIFWSELAECICEWAHEWFPFDYCDVVASRLETVFSIGTVSTKAAAALALAELGASHNRWYCMRILMRLCGKKLSSAVAERIRIELLTGQGASKFLRCAEGIGMEPDDYHEVIAEVVAAEA